MIAIRVRAELGAIKRHSPFGLLLLSCLGVGCESSPDAVTTNLRRDLEETRAKVAEMEVRLAVVEMVNRDARDRYSVAVFDPAADQGFARLDTTVGTLAVTFKEVSPYADGVKLRFHIGNLTSATVSGAKARVKWGARLSQGSDAFDDHALEDWQATLREREVEISDDLRPGRWSDFVVALPATKPESLGYVEMSIDASQISLPVGK